MTWSTFWQCFWIWYANNIPLNPAPIVSIFIRRVEGSFQDCQPAVVGREHAYIVCNFRDLVAFRSGRWVVPSTIRTEQVKVRSHCMKRFSPRNVDVSGIVKSFTAPCLIDQKFSDNEMTARGFADSWKKVNRSIWASGLYSESSRCVSWIENTDSFKSTIRYCSFQRRFVELVRGRRQAAILRGTSSSMHRVASEALLPTKCTINSCIR